MLALVDVFIKWGTVVPMQILRKNIYKRYIRCPLCGRVMVLWSRSFKKRKAGHIKTMNCYYCGETVNGIEEKEFDQAAEALDVEGGDKDVGQV